MVVIRGKVDPARSTRKHRGLRAFFGPPRWRLEYVVRDEEGSRIGRGAVKAQSDGCFAIALDAPTPRVVEIRVKSAAAESGDYCTIDVRSDNDIINLPRRLNPN